MSKVRNTIALGGSTVLTDAEAIFYDAVQTAEATWQSADKSTQAKVRAADIARHRAIRDAAAVAGNSGPAGHLGGPARAALQELTGGT
jgi:hypothetical protein